MSKQNIPIEDLTFIVDTREQRPFDFAPIEPKIRIQKGTLQTADYSIMGLENEVCVERKGTVEELLGNIGTGRERFEAELIRMREFKAKMVVICEPWDMMGFTRCKISPKSVMGSIASWTTWGIPFYFFPNAQIAAQMTARFLYIYANHQFRNGREFGLIQSCKD